GTKLGPGQTDSGTGRRWIFVVLGLVVLGGLLAGAYFVGADSADEATERADNAEDEANELSEEVKGLNERLEAELGLSGQDSADRDQVVSSADADLELGEAGRVGDLLLRPT